MAQIGIFTKGSDGSFSGEIGIPSFQAGNVRLVPEASRPSEVSTTHREMVGRIEIGAGCTKTSSEGSE